LFYYYYYFLLFVLGVFASNGVLRLLSFIRVVLGGNSPLS